MEGNGNLCEEKEDPQFPHWQRMLKYAELAKKGTSEWDIVKIFLETCQTHPDKTAMVWVDGNGTEKIRINFGQFYLRIRNLAYHISLLPELEIGDRVILCYEPGLDFFIAFWACVSLRYIVVPITPPDPLALNVENDATKKLLAVVRDCDPKLILTSNMYYSAVGIGKLLNNQSDSKSAFPANLTKYRWICTDDLLHRSPPTEKKWDLDSVTITRKENATDTIFLQYTSGSTGEPKGVIVTHNNIPCNVLNCARMTKGDQSFIYYKETVAVSWLPHFHDMGLFGFHLGPLVMGITVVYFSPLDFVQTPILWLQVMSKYGNMKPWSRVVSGAPPFGLDMCVNKISKKQKDALDLRCVDLIILGAEPIRESSLSNFFHCFQSTGFRASAYSPAYGLAENVLHVTNKEVGTGAPVVINASRAELAKGRLVPIKGSDHGQLLVSSGIVEKGALTVESNDCSLNRVVIVDLKTLEPLPDGMIGEIWVNGPSKAKGYWNRESLNHKTFLAKLRIKDSLHHKSYHHLVQEEFLRTGDLGAILNQQLYVTGRSKDMIIINGANYYPQDIEDAVRGIHPAIRPGSIVAIPLTLPLKPQVGMQEKEVIGIFCELRDVQGTNCNPKRFFQQRVLRPMKPHIVRYMIKGLELSSRIHFPRFLNSMFNLVSNVMPRVVPAFIKEKAGLAQASAKTMYRGAIAMLPALKKQHSQELLVHEDKNVDCDPEFQRIIQAIRGKVLSRFGLGVGVVVLLSPNTIKKTSSGKNRRVLLKEEFLNGILTSRTLTTSILSSPLLSTLSAPKLAPSPWTIHSETPKLTVASASLPSQPASETRLSPIIDLPRESSDPSVPVLQLADVKRRIALVVGQELKLLPEEKNEDALLLLIKKGETLDEKSLTEFGVDSLTILQLCHRLTTEFGLQVPLSPFMFLSDPSFDGIAKTIIRFSTFKMPSTSNFEEQSNQESKSHPPILPQLHTQFNLRSERTSSVACILGLGCAVPGPGMQQKMLIRRQVVNLGLDEKAANNFLRIGEGTKIDRRYSIFNSVDKIYFGKRGIGNSEHVEKRNDIFRREAPKLSIQSCKKAIKDWGGSKDDITHVIAVTCTGVIIPGLEFEVMRGLQLRRETERLSIQFMGCFGALSGLKAAKAIAAESCRNRILVVCTELCSLHMQLDSGLENLVASALFADGSAAMIIGAEPRDGERAIFEIHKSSSVVIPNTVDLMGWKLSNTGMIIGLDKSIPAQIYENIAPYTKELLSFSGEKSLNLQDCRWAIHPGGPMIIEAICSALNLNPRLHAEASWEVLRRYGNMSSATLIFVFDYLRKQPPPKTRETSWVVSMSFGPGLNVEGALLRIPVK